MRRLASELTKSMNQNFFKEKKLSDGIRKKDSGFSGNHLRSPVRPARRQEIFDARTREEEEGKAAPQIARHQAESGEEEVFSSSPHDPFFARARRRLRGTEGNPAVRRVWWGIAVGSAAALAAVIAVSTKGAGLTIAVHPRMERVALEDIGARFDTAETKITPGERVIPAERFEATRSVRREFGTTEKKDVRERARGKVTIYNQFSASAQIFVARTRFMTDGEIVFRLIRPITVPGAKIAEGKIIAQSIEAELTADEPGEQYNIAGKITLRIPGLKGNPKYDGFYAVSDQGFSGGAAGMMSVAGADEIARAEEAVTKEASETLIGEMARQMPPGLIWRDQMREVTIKRVDAPRPGTPGEKFVVEAAATGRVLAFRESDVITLIKDAVVGADPTRALVDGSTEVEYAVRSIDFDLGRADVLIRGSVKTASVIPESELALLVAGKKEGSIADALRSRPEVSGFTLSFFPPWRRSAPKDSGKIRFVAE